MSDETKALAAVDPGGLLNVAIEKGVSVETIERLTALYERAQDRAAKDEMNLALANFQNECPAIVKSSRAEIATKSGANYGYNYAALPDIERAIRPVLSAHGLSYSWDSEDLGDKIKVSCVISHVGGHTKSASFTCQVDSSSPRMSGPQKCGAALTYARRQSLVQALGLTQCDPDTDGINHAAQSDDPVTAEQANTLRELARDAFPTEASIAQFFSRVSKKVGISVEKFEEIPAREFAALASMLRRRAAQSEGAQ